MFSFAFTRLDAYDYGVETDINRDPQNDPKPSSGPRPFRHPKQIEYLNRFENWISIRKADRKVLG